MPAFNRAYCIKDSIRSALRQKESNFEIIVFDDGSTDGTADVVRSIGDKRIKIGRDPKNRGVNFSRNRAIEMATGEWLVLLDSDDKLTENAFEVMKRDISELSEDVALIFYGTKDRASGKMKSHFHKKKGIVSYDEWVGELTLKGEFLAMVRRKVFADEMFPEDMVAFEKYFWLKLFQKYKILIHNTVVRIYEADNNNRQTRQLMKPEWAEPRARSYKKFLDAFGTDMRRVNPKLYAHYLCVMAHLYFLSGNKVEGRKALKLATQNAPSLKTYGLIFTSYLGRWPFHLATKIAQRLV
jgi:glycosyltransferase involved in cell wall biosynthesis